MSPLPPMKPGMFLIELFAGAKLPQTLPQSWCARCEGPLEEAKLAAQATLGNPHFTWAERYEISDHLGEVVASGPGVGDA